MRHARTIVLALSLIVAVNASPAVVQVATAEQADVSITGVTVSPDDPAPGQDFTVTVNVSNLASSNGTVSVTDVYVRVQNRPKEFSRVQNVGAITPGNTLSVPLSLSIPETGSKKLQVHAVVETADGQFQHLEYPLLVTVTNERSVLVSVQASKATVDTETSVNVTVANGDAATVSGVKLHLAGDGTVVDPERITGSIKPGVDRTFQYDVTFDERGTRTLNATVTYSTSGGASRTVSDSTGFEVTNESTDSGKRIEGTIRLVGVETSGNGIVTIQGDAANVGGTNVKSVLLRVKNTAHVSPMGSSGEYFVGAVNDSQFDTFELIARTTDQATVIPVQVEYITDGEQKTETVRINVSSSGDTSRQIPNEGMQRRNRFTPPGEQRSGFLGGLGGVVIPLLGVGMIAGGAYFVRKYR